MDDQNQNCTANPSLNSTPTNQNVSPALLGSPRTTNTEIVPVVTDSVGGNSDPVVVKRKRGRPRKTEVSRNLVSPVSAPSGFPASSFGSSSKRGRGRPKGSGKLQLLASLGGIVSDTAGGCFTPHVVTVNTGEDVASKILSFCNKGPRSVCILSATGAVSNADISYPSAPGGVLRCEGRYEILSLSGSYTLGSSGRRKNLTLSVSLARSDGTIYGGVVQGHLIAAAPIQLVVGSFKQNISSEIKRRLSPGFSGAANSHDEASGAANSHDEPSGAANTHDEPDPLAMSLQVPKMIEAEQSLPSPTSGLMPTTTNGLPVHVMTGTSNGRPNNVTSSSTNNGVPVNFFHENHQNMNPASLNGIGLDRQNMQPVTNQMTFGDVNNSVSKI